VAKQRTPRSIGRYEVRKELGRGTMGVVYEARDPVLDRTIALKTIGASSLSGAERKRYEKRFLAEARAAARLSHPGIVVVHDVGRDASTGLLYIALERLEGETLASRIESGRPLDWREALRLVSRVAEALHHAHAQGVVHRDVKPANVMVLRSGEPKIMDFGIARVDASHLTSPGELFGTPLYMAPEQALGRPADARSDLFSLGTIAYTLLTGRAPFAASSVPAILARVAHRHAAPPSAIVKKLPPAIDDIVARAMAKAPEDRYPSGKMLAEDVQDVLDGHPPRHRGSWTVPAGGQTIVSAAIDGDVPELELVEDAPAVPRRRRPRRFRSRLGRVALAALAGAGAYHFWVHPEDVGYWQGVGQQARRLLSGPTAPSAAPTEPKPLPPRPSPTPEPTVAPVADEIVPTPEPSPDAPGADAALETGDAPMDESPPAMPPDPVAHGETTPVQEAPPPVGEGEAEGPVPVPPQTTPPQTEEPSRPAPRPATLVAWLSIGFEHHHPNGTLEVWVDGKRVVKEALDSRVTRKLLGFELRAGSVQQTLGLTPGRHEVRVRVRSGDDDKTARASATFRAAATRRLEVKAPRLRGGLSLEWK
jgi:hypothetical protein